MKISVYITCFNQEQYIRFSVESALKQTLRPHEVIIIDDCSTDSSVKIIKETIRKHSNVRFIQNHANKGISKNRNLALEMATGDFISGLDGDDYWMPEKLNIESRALIENKADFAFSMHQNFTTNDELDHLKSNQNIDFHIFEIEELYLKTAMRGFGPSLYRSELVKLDTIKEVGGYDETLALYEDYDLKMRLSYSHAGAYSPTITQGYRVNIGGLSSASSIEHFRALSYIYSKNIERFGPGKDEVISYFGNKLFGSLLNARNKRQISIQTFFKCAHSIAQFNRSRGKDVLKILKNELFS